VTHNHNGNVSGLAAPHFVDPLDGCMTSPPGVAQRRELMARARYVERMSQDVKVYNAATLIVFFNAGSGQVPVDYVNHVCWYLEQPKISRQFGHTTTPFQRLHVQS